jgi:signal transduction histidine kinase
MEEVLSSSAEGGDLRYAMIVDPNGRVLANTERDKIGKYLRDETSVAALAGEQKPHLIASDSSTLYAAAPVSVKGRLIGWSLLALDKSTTNAYLDYVTRTGIFYTLAAIFAGTVFAVFLAKSILNQLRLLLQGVDRLAKDQLDQPVPIVSHDEVGRVSLALNDAARSLQESRARVQQEMSVRQKAEQDFRSLSHRQIGVIEEERKRIAQDLHDEFGQALTSVQFGLTSLQREIPAGAAPLKARCDQLAALVEQMGNSIDTIASDLRPAALDHIVLVPAVESYLSELARRGFGLKTEFQAVGFSRRLDPEVELACYRIIQEGLTNIAKHAKATRAEIRLVVSHPNVILTIRDDGQGVGLQEVAGNAQVSPHRLGILGMRERAASVGGTFEIRLGSAGGGIVRVELPVKPRLTDEQD